MPYCSLTGQLQGRPAAGQSGEGRQARERKVFFFEKKKQKTFTPSLWPQARAQ
jgi:hypothetical protein